MDDILYNSKSELDKLPFGAVVAGTRVSFGIRTSEMLEITELRLIVLNDYNGATVEYSLERVWTELGYTRFEGSACFEDAGLYWYHFKALTADSEKVIEKAEKGARLTDNEPNSWQLSVYSSDYTTPEWIMGGAFYHIFIDRFCKGVERPIKEGSIARSDWSGIPYYKPDDKGEIRNNDFFGGNLDGIIQKLPYLHELGISCIYLSPTFEAASNHKYDTADYQKIDPSFGDEESFVKLNVEAGKLGIRVICDGVFNHTGSDSVYFNRLHNYGDSGAYNKKDSPFYEWYAFSDWPEKYDAWWGIKTLPQIKKESESFRNFITGENGVLNKWMSCGAYGWRLDVADELSESFLRELRKAVKSNNPEALIIGEVWEDASNKVSYGSRRHYFEGAELDSVMNYPFKDAIINFLKTGEANILSETVESICENYPKPALDCLMNILGTHDTVRILTALSGIEFNTRDERSSAALSVKDLDHSKTLLRLATTLQFALPGVPCIYYGDEAGLEGYEDPFNRRCYPWGDEDSELIEWYKTLLKARNNCKAFAGGDCRTLRAENGALTFIRSRNGSKVLTLVNMGAESVEIELSGTENLLAVWNCEENKNSLRVFHEGCAILELAEV